MLTEHELNEYFTKYFHRTAFRLEVRDSYAVANEQDGLDRYLAGEGPPDQFHRSPWLDELRTDTSRGKRWQWVHVVRSPLSLYLRYALEWGYAANVRAGAEVRIFDLAEHPKPAELLEEDFWLLDEEAVLRMRYDELGHYLGAEAADIKELHNYRAARAAVWQAAEPLTSYWQTHPQYHRVQAA